MMTLVQKFSSPADLANVCEKLKKAKEELAGRKKLISICVGGGCIASGSLKIKEAFDEGLKKHEKPWDELWIAEKFQSNSEIVGSPRNSFRASVEYE